jgi:hypothetical protein
VAAPSQRRALGTLFLVLALMFVGIAFAAGLAAAREGRVELWAIAGAAAAIGLWIGSVGVGALRRA